MKLYLLYIKITLETCHLDNLDIFEILETHVRNGMKIDIL